VNWPIFLELNRISIAINETVGIYLFVVFVCFDVSCDDILKR